MSEVGRQRKNLLFSGHGCRRLADNGKINHGKGMFGAAALTFPFQITKLVKGHGDGQEKGVLSEVKEQLQTERNLLSAIKSYEVVFHRYNFLHLTGVRVNDSRVGSAIHFYEKCLASRLTEDDFHFAKDGSTVQKLDVLESMMEIKHNAMMIGDFTDRGPKLFTEKAVGNICGCVGFVKDRNTRLNMPNMLWKKDILDVVSNQV